jgi:uncharacterized iron-regulated membrane protein
MSVDRESPHRARHFYAAVWRWHFYAGVAVLPFLLTLAVTGLLMLAGSSTERYRHPHLYHVEPGHEALPASDQVAAVVAAYPHADVTMFVPPRATDASSQVSIVPHGGAEAAHGAAHGAAPTISVFVDPYTGSVLGALDPEDTLYAWAKRVHGTLLLGDVGDYIVEVAAGFGVLLVASGVFLWWPREGQPLRRLLFPALSGAGRRRWRGLHAAAGAWLAPFLLFFLVSGLAWTPFWGGALVQAWSSLPGEEFAAPLAEETHAKLNRGNLREIPWALEQTPLPVPPPHAATHAPEAGAAITLDDVIAHAHAIGLTSFRVHLPHEHRRVWTIAATTIGRDSTDPRADRIVHLDPRTGGVLGDVGFADYSVMGKLMAATIPLHQGDVGLVNLALNALFGLAVVVLGVAALLAWWTRRPARAFRLVPPPLPRDLRAWRGAVAVMLVLSLAFPLVAATIVAVLALDLALVSRVRSLRLLFD